MTYVLTDNFTRYAQAFPAKSKKAQTVAKILIEWPTQDPIRSRNGFRESPDPRSLEDDGSQEVKDYSISSAGRSSVREIQPNLALYTWDSMRRHEKKRQWSQHVGYLVHTYNSTKCDATGYSPYFLMFGREARLPVDLCLVPLQMGRRRVICTMWRS